MEALLDERFIGVTSVCDLIRKTSSDNAVVLSLEEIENIIKAMNTIQQSATLLPGAEETDQKNEQKIIYRQLDDVYNIILKNIK